MSRPIRRARALAVLGMTFLFDLFASSIAVARIVLSREPRQSPAIIAIPIDLRTETAVVMFAYFTSLTPGSTCLHVANDRRMLYVHVLDSPSDEVTIARFKRLYERWLRELER